MLTTIFESIPDGVLLLGKPDPSDAPVELQDAVAIQQQILSDEENKAE